MAVKISGVKKLKLKKDAVIDVPKMHAMSMYHYTRIHAPEDTSTLKNHGIDIEDMENGGKVFLNTDAIRANYPDERQQKRPDGGNYGYYQEEGWTQHGVHHPGKHYFKKGFETSEISMEYILGQVIDKIVTTE